MAFFNRCCKSFSKNFHNKHDPVWILRKLILIKTEHFGTTCKTFSYLHEDVFLAFVGLLFMAFFNKLFSKTFTIKLTNMILHGFWWMDVFKNLLACTNCVKNNNCEAFPHEYPTACNTVCNATSWRHGHQNKGRTSLVRKDQLTKTADAKQ